MIEVTVNGKAKEIALSTTLSQLLAELKITDKFVLVEKNGDAVDRADYSKEIVQAGDVLEIVRLMGGG